MRDPLTHADDIALYLLCRMYDKHVYVHTACYGWCTIPIKFDTKLDAVLPKCDLELVLLLKPIVNRFSRMTHQIEA